MTPWIDALGIAVVLSVGWGAWLAMTWPQPLSWHAPLPKWEQGLNEMARRVRLRLSPPVVAQADVLKISGQWLLGMGLSMGVLGGLMMALVLPWHWLGIPFGLVLFYVAPSWSVRRQFQRYQLIMRMAFETQVLLLRIYFDLGMSVTAALRAMRTALDSTARQEVERVLQDLAAGNQDQALLAWAERTQLMEYRLLARTIVQQRGRALRGEALEPLEVLLTANRQQSMKTLTDKLTSGAAIVPILSTFAVTLLYLYALMTSIHGLQNLQFHW